MDQSTPSELLAHTPEQSARVHQSGSWMSWSARGLATATPQRVKAGRERMTLRITAARR
jgi:hypothetical protein